MMSQNLLKKFLVMLTICLTINTSFGQSITILKNALDMEPPLDSRFKLIHSYSNNNAWILHNAYREKEIKNKLFSCKTLRIKNAELKKLALDIKPEVKTYLFKNPTLIIGGFAIALSVGIALGVIVSK